MPYQPDWLERPDAARLRVHRWHPDSPPRATLLISHGMAEHAQRYQRLAASCTEKGYQVVALDQRGHGASAACGQLGHFADQHGWRAVIDDLGALLEQVRHEQPTLPICLLGHSMGSYISQGLLLRQPEAANALILSGSNAHPPWLSRLARFGASIEGQLRGWQQPALTIERLSFGQFNRQFRPNRTRADWLSRDPLEVDQYLSDPLCGFTCSTRLWYDLFGGLLEIADPTALQRLPASLPVLIIGGDADPVSAGDGLKKLYRRLQSAGLERVELRLYPGARHELFNETNRTQVTQDLLDWLAQTLPAAIQHEENQNVQA